MPSVPVEQRQNQVGGIAAPRVNTLPTEAPIEAFGGGSSQAAVGKAFSGAVGAVGKIAEEERQKANDTVTTDYYAKLAQKKQELFWDPKVGVMTKKGKDSFAAVDEYGKQFEDYANELEKDMNAEQVAMAKRIRAKEGMEFNGQIMRHVSQESQEYQKNTVSAGITAARNDAILNYNDPAAIQDKIKLQEAIYQQTASGKPAALVEVEMKDLRSKTHSAVIDRMLDNGSDLQAKQYYDQVKGDLSGPDIDTVEKNLRSGILVGEAQRQSDSIFASSPNSMGEALGKARQIEDPKLRDETTKRVKDLFDLKKAAESQRDEENHQRAGNIIDQTGDTDKIPRSIWNQFSVAEKSSLDAYAKHRKMGTEPATKWEEYYNLKTMAATPALRNEFLQTNLMKYRNDLGNTEFKELISAQQSLRKGDDKTVKLLDGYRSDSEIVNTALKEAGVDTSSKAGTEEFKKVALFRRQVDERVVSLQERTGKKVSNADIQSITDNLMVEGVTEKGWFWDTKKRAFEVQPGEQLEVAIKDVPAKERAKIEQALRNRGIAPTDAKIVELFMRKNVGSK